MALTIALTLPSRDDNVSTTVMDFVAVPPSLYLNATVFSVNKGLYNGSAGHGSRVKWVNKSEWVTWVTGQYS